MGQTWEENYLIKIFNNGNARLQITSNADYETINDPDSLRSDINIEIFEWSDTNQNGLLDENELGNSLGKKTIIKWKTEGILIGEMDPGTIKPLVLRFSTLNLSETKQGSQAIIDYIFDAIEME